MSKLSCFIIPALLFLSSCNVDSNEKSIEKFLNEMGYDMLDHSNVEDIIRISNDEHQNILTCIFKKRK